MVGLKLLPIPAVHLQRRIPMASSHDRLIESLTLNYSEAAVETLEDLTESFLITDPSISGHPIVFASRGFLAMSGYSREEVVGRNGRIFQGPATDRRSVMEIREAIRGERTVQISLINYRKDGTPHRILFHLSPVFGGGDGEGSGRVIHFLAVQVPIAARRTTCPRRAGRVGSCRDEMREERMGIVPCGDSESDLFQDADSRGLPYDVFFFNFIDI